MKNLENSEIEKLSLRVIPCRETIPPEAYHAYNSAYHLWERVWSETLKELDGVKKLFSNEFTRHDFATVLYRDDIAIALMCYSAVNLNLDVRKNDSWFESWPQEFLAEQSIREGEGLIAAWFCTAPEYRKSQLNYPINSAKLIMEAFGKIVLEDGYNVGYGTSRNNRSVNKLLYEIGGEKRGESLAHGCEVDLILVEPDKVREAQLSYSNLFKKLWEEKIDYRKRGYEQELSKTA
ncbi:MAG: hypothetical protein H7281_03675 [Bacteriovorax sp.]|nr:hypothetical protein [Bacteriovorax sp.]